jgi:parallel beta-helix repeat protein
MYPPYGVGIHFLLAKNSLAIGNILNNQYVGISANGQNITIENNIMNNNKMYGIEMTYCSGCIARNNYASNNQYFGILIQTGKNTSLIGNNFSNNARAGMEIAANSQNTIVSNNIACGNSYVYVPTGRRVYDIECFSSASGSGNKFGKVYGCNNVSYVGC